jgi:hypothetical protein
VGGIGRELLDSLFGQSASLVRALVAMELGNAFTLNRHEFEQLSGQYLEQLKAAKVGRRAPGADAAAGATSLASSRGRLMHACPPTPAAGRQPQRAAQRAPLAHHLGAQPGRRRRSRLAAPPELGADLHAALHPAAARLWALVAAWRRRPCQQAGRRRPRAAQGAGGGRRCRPAAAAAGADLGALCMLRSSRCR